MGLILCCLTAQAEKIRRLIIDDFSGGINMAAPSQVANDECRDLYNFDIVDGALVPRFAFDAFTLAEDSLAGNSIQALIPYNYIGNKHLLIQRTGGYPKRVEISWATNFGSDHLYIDTLWVDDTAHILTWFYDWPDSANFSQQKMIDLINADTAASVHCTAAAESNYYTVTLKSTYENSTLRVGTDDSQWPLHMEWIANNTMLYSMIRHGTEDSVLDQYNAIRYSGRPHTGVSTLNWSGKIWIASYGSEMMIFDGEKMYPARPLGPGQLEAIAIDNSGHTTTLTAKQVRYRYAWEGSIPDPNLRGNLSIPSFPIDVYNGVVHVTGVDRGGTGDTMTFLYRSIEGGDYESLGKVRAVTFIDSVVSAGSSPTYPYGDYPRCYSQDNAMTCPCWTDEGGILGYPPPGAIIVNLGLAADSGYGIAWPDTIQTVWGNTSQKSIAYSLVFVDTLGRRSYMAPPFCVQYDSCNAGGCPNPGGKSKMLLTDIPLAPDTNIIVKRIILRSFAPASDDSLMPGSDGDFDPEGCRDAGNWYVVDTLYDDTATTYTDSMPACSIHIDDRLYCEAWEPYEWTLSEYLNEPDATADNPCANCLDSVIQFKPTAIIQRGAQAYAIGDPKNPNRIYMSTFYDPDVEWTPSTWPLDKYIEVFPNGDDWFVALAVLGDDIYAFRQNSIVKISGLEFWSWRVETISTDVGAFAPRSVAATLSHIYFLDNSGVYVTNGGEPIKISTPIDTFFTKINFSCPECSRGMIGTAIGTEYWLQTGYEYTFGGTLIFDEITGAWRRWSPVYSDIVFYSDDTTELDWKDAQPVVVMDDSMLYQLSTSRNIDIFADTLDNGYTAYYSAYHSREFFEGPAREKIHYIDVYGRGNLDSIKIYAFHIRSGSLSSIMCPIDSAIVTFPFWTATPTNPVRFALDVIAPSFQFMMFAYPDQVGSGQGVVPYKITSIVIGWQPWDERRLWQ